MRFRKSRLLVACPCLSAVTPGLPVALFPAKAGLRNLGRAIYLSLNPNQWVTYRQITHHFIRHREMFQTRPRRQPLLIVRLQSPEHQERMCHRPFIPVHHVFRIGPALFIKHIGIDKSDSLFHVLVSFCRISPQVVGSSERV